MTGKPSSMTTALEAAVTTVLFGASPVLSLLATNFQQMELGSAIRSIVVSIAAALLLLLILRVALRTWIRAAILACALILLFFSYGHVYDLVRHLTIAGVLIGRHRVLVAAWVLLGLLLVWLLGARLRATRRSLRVALVAGLGLVIVPLASLGAQAAHAAQAARSTPSFQPQAASAETTAGDSLPDIYYIILDGYGRSDVLRDFYGVDNSRLIRFLESRGFFVATDAHANYMQTGLSLASSLNMRYLADLLKQEGRESTDRSPVKPLVQHSEVRSFLEAHGYQTVSFMNGESLTQWRDAALFLTPQYEVLPSERGLLLRGFALNEFEGLLLETTLARPLMDSMLQSQNALHSLIEDSYRYHRTQILYTFSALPHAASADGPQFVFAHIMAPHPPFVFGAHGEEVPNTRPFDIQDVGCCSRSDYIKGYAAQVTFISMMLEDTIDQILARSAQPPVIIIQGDHGPGANMDAYSADGTNMRERLGILNAYFIPRVAPGVLYPSITPVNTFRVVLNTYFGTGYGLLPDRSYFSSYRTLYDFVDVTQRAETDQVLQP
jgi:Sulfatase